MAAAGPDAGARNAPLRAPAVPLPPVPEPAEWVDVPELSERTNALMRRNNELMRDAARLLKEGGDCLEIGDVLQDIWLESVDLETKYLRSSDADFEWRWR